MVGLTSLALETEPAPKTKRSKGAFMKKKEMKKQASFAAGSLPAGGSTSTEPFNRASRTSQPARFPTRRRKQGINNAMETLKSRRSSTSEAFAAAVKRRTDKAAMDADSRNIPVKYEDTVSVDRQRINLLQLTRKSDPLGVVWGAPPSVWSL